MVHTFLSYVFASFSVPGNSVDIEIPESFVPDPNDPDSDPEIPSDDDEDEDDDEEKDEDK